METLDLRAEFTKETKTRFNTEWIAYNDYADWLEKKLVKLLTIPHVSVAKRKVCPQCKREFDQTEVPSGIFCCYACEYGY